MRDVDIVGCGVGGRSSGGIIKIGMVRSRGMRN